MSEKSKKNSKLGKRPNVKIDSLNLSTATLKRAKKIMDSFQGIITPYQLRILSLYKLKSVVNIEKDHGYSKSSIYAVFRVLREKKRKAGILLKLLNDLSRDPRFHPILTFRPSLEEEKSEE